jgi:hypothetical protein
MQLTDPNNSLILPFHMTDVQYFLYLRRSRVTSDGQLYVTRYASQTMSPKFGLNNSDSAIPVHSVSDPHWLHADPDTDPDPAF